MDLFTATTRVKNALSKRDYIAELTHYHLRDKQIFASNGAMTASAPISEPLEHVVPADELDKALSILGGDADFVWEDEKLTVKKGKRRITIRLLKPETVALTEPVHDKIPVPPCFVNGMRKIRPFLSDDATRPWALTAWLRWSERLNQHVFVATNNITVAEATADQAGMLIEPRVDAQIPNFAIDFVLGREQILQYIAVNENKVTFYFDDYSQMTTLLFVQKMPDKVATIIDDVTPADPSKVFVLSGEWKAAYRSLTDLRPEEIEIKGSVMTAGRRQATMEVEVDSPTPNDGRESSLWSEKFFTPVVDVATELDITAYPKPSYFAGPGIRGITIGKAR